jgi:hypothetical protein
MNNIRVRVYSDRINVTLDEAQFKRAGGKASLFSYSNKKGRVEVQLIVGPDAKNPGTRIMGKGNRPVRRIQFTQYGLAEVPSFKAEVSVENDRLVLRNKQPVSPTVAEPLERVFG